MPLSTGAGIAEGSQGMAYNEFEFRLLSTMTKEDEEGHPKLGMSPRKAKSPQNRKASLA